MAMQLAPVAPGLAGMAAVIARGAEPFVVFPPGHALITCAAKAINARPLAGGAGHEACESAVANILDNYFFYLGNMVGNVNVIFTSRSCAKRETLWQQLVADGLDTTVIYNTAAQLRTAIDLVVATFNLNALPAAYMLTPVIDFVDKEPAAALAGPPPPPPPVLS